MGAPPAAVGAHAAENQKRHPPGPRKAGRKDKLGRGKQPTKNAQSAKRDDVTDAEFNEHHNRSGRRLYTTVNFEAQRQALNTLLSQSEEQVHDVRGKAQDDTSYSAGPHDTIIQTLINSHQRVQSTVNSGKESMRGGVIALCSLHSNCGGHGDRVYGLILIYLTALLSRRAFFIYHSRPLPLENFLEPNRLE